MNLYDVYQEYKKVNEEYVEYIKNLLEMKFENNDDEEIKEKLETYKNKFEELKVESDKIETDDEVNLKDLQYLIVDAIFIGYDLKNFYEVKEFERLKMRIANYVNKMRRKENNII